MHRPHRLLCVAHGTASPQGAATTDALVAAIAAARPSVAIELCFLDVAAPRLPECLDERPTVVVPLLLSTGYHVQTDIPRAVLSTPATVVARHLGPHPLVIDVLAERLGPVSKTVVLVGAGSSRPEAAGELATAAGLLSVRAARPVEVLTMADDLRRELSSREPPVAVATYLLAPGHFVDRLRDAADGYATVSAPLGVHPALVELVWHRYDEALAWVR